MNDYQFLVTVRCETLQHAQRALDVLTHVGWWLDYPYELVNIEYVDGGAL